MLTIAAGVYLPVTSAVSALRFWPAWMALFPLGTGNDRRWYFPKARLLGHVLDLASATVHHAVGLTTREQAAVVALLARRLDSVSGKGADRVRRHSGRPSCQPAGWPVSGAVPDGVRRLPYPHARNDCVLCREQDAGFHVPARDLPNGYTALYCRRCIGEFLITQVVFGRGSDVPRGAPATIEYEVLSPTREPW